MIRLILLLMGGLLAMGAASGELPASRGVTGYPGSPAPQDAPLAYESALGYRIVYDAQAILPPGTDAPDEAADVFTALGAQGARLTVTRRDDIKPLKTLAAEVEAALRADLYSVIPLETEGLFEGQPALGLSALRGDDVAECYVVDTAHAQFILRLDFPIAASDTAGEALYDAATSFRPI